MIDWASRCIAACLIASMLGGCLERTSSDASARETEWASELESAAERIDAAMPGNFGVHIRKLGKGGGVFERGGDRRWYLSSTVKIPVAIAVMERVDKGQLDLEEKITLRQSDFVDGSGDLIWQEPGAEYTIAQLVEKSLENSDSTATDMLIRRIGEQALNERVQAWTNGGFGRITTILQVRYDAYGALHPEVTRLSNMQIVALRNAEAGEPRLQALANALGVPRTALNAESLEAVFENYYRRGDNSASLAAFATLLEKLVSGRLLSAQSTERILDHMRKITTGDKRIMAGLPDGIDFAQKTGTQVARACNVGVVNAALAQKGAVVVVACAEQFDALVEAEQAFQELGVALSETGLLESQS